MTPVVIPVITTDPTTEPAGRWRERAWRWLAESAAVFPGGATAYMLLTLEDERPDRPPPGAGDR